MSYGNLLNVWPLFRLASVLIIVCCVTLRLSKGKEGYSVPIKEKRVTVFQLMFVPTRCVMFVAELKCLVKCAFRCAHNLLASCFMSGYSVLTKIITKGINVQVFLVYCRCSDLEPKLHKLSCMED